jgi:hypothetical protein
MRKHDLEHRPLCSLYDALRRAARSYCNWRPRIRSDAKFLCGSPLGSLLVSAKSGTGLIVPTATNPIGDLFSTGVDTTITFDEGIL